MMHTLRRLFGRFFGKPDAVLITYIQQAFEFFRQFRLQEAESAAHAILAREGEQEDALLLLGLLACAGQDWGRSLAFFERAIHARPQFIDPYIELFRTLLMMGQIELGERFLKLVEQRFQSNAALWCQLADLLVELRPAEALRLYQRTLSLSPDLLEARLGCCNALIKLGRFNETNHELDSLEAGQPISKSILVVRALCVRAAGDYPRAADLLSAAVARWGDDPALRYLACTVHERAGQFARAENAVDELLATFPGNPEGQFAKTSYLMRRGEFREGFAQYEGRRQLQHVPVSRLSGFNEWDASQPSSQTVVVFVEQGLGDTLMYLRFLPALAKVAGKVRFVTPLPLYALCASQPHLEHIEIVPETVTPLSHLGDGDTYLNLMSIPHKLSIQTPLTEHAYLTPDMALTGEWRVRLRPFRRRVGMVWSASLNSALGAEKSLDLRALDPLFQVPDCTFVSLQYGYDGDLPDHVHNFGKNMHDLADAAAIVANLDLVISVDTATAHLAGALGTPVWLLTPVVLDWRWAGPDESERRYWYPSVRLFRQQVAGDWAPVVTEAAQALQQWCMAQPASADSGGLAE